MALETVNLTSVEKKTTSTNVFFILLQRKMDQTISEETKNFARKLENEKRALETANDVLKEKLQKKIMEGKIQR